VKERVEIITTISADHSALGARLDALDAQIKAASDQGAIAALKGDLRSFRELVEPHLLEEEEDTLPKLMQAFERDEIRPVEQEMMKSFTWADFPHMLRRLGPSIEAKRALAVDRMGMPEPVFKKKGEDLARYEYEYASIIDSLLDPSKKPEIDQIRANYELEHPDMSPRLVESAPQQGGSWLSRVMPCFQAQPRRKKGGESAHGVFI